MNDRQKYVQRRLMELALTAQLRPLESVEVEEEKRLTEELKSLVNGGK